MSPDPHPPPATGAGSRRRLLRTAGAMIGIVLLLVLIAVWAQRNG